MKIILFFATIYLFVRAIKRTPYSLSKKMRLAAFKVNAESVKRVKRESPERFVAYEKIATIITILTSMVVLTYYFQMSRVIPKNTVFTILTISQYVLTIFAAFSPSYMYSDNESDYKDQPLFYVVNLIVDYLYYSFALLHFLFIL